MLPPPVDETVLRNNPSFASLYSRLTKAVLNADGSTRDDVTPTAKERHAVRQELHKERLKAAKEYLIIRAIATATPPSSSAEPKRQPSISSTANPSKNQAVVRRNAPASTAAPDPQLLDLLVSLPPLLSSSETSHTANDRDQQQQQPNPLSPPSLRLLLSSPPLSQLEYLLPPLSALISSHLRASALDLSRIAHPSTNPSYLHRHVATLSRDVSALTATVANAQHELATGRLATLTSLAGVLRAHAECIAHLIRSLEAKHGAVARSLELRAADVSMQAQRGQVDAHQALKSLRKEIYTPEAVAALQHYAAHLKDARIRVSERIRGLGAELGEYGVGVEGGQGKEKMMREMARVYRGMTRKMGDVKGDLDRLRDR